MRGPGLRGVPECQQERTPAHRRIGPAPHNSTRYAGPEHPQQVSPPPRKEGAAFPPPGRPVRGPRPLMDSSVPLYCRGGSSRLGRLRGRRQGSGGCRSPAVMPRELPRPLCPGTPSALAHGPCFQHLHWAGRLGPGREKQESASPIPKPSLTGLCPQGQPWVAFFKRGAPPLGRWWRPASVWCVERHNQGSLTF